MGHRLLAGFGLGAALLLELLGQRRQFAATLQRDAHMVLLDGGGAVGGCEGLEIVLLEPLGFQLVPLLVEPAHGLVDLLGLASLDLELHLGAREGKLHGREFGHPLLQQALQHVLLHAGRPIGDEWRQLARFQPIGELLRLAVLVLPADVELTAAAVEIGLPGADRQRQPEAAEQGEGDHYLHSGVPSGMQKWPAMRVAWPDNKTGSRGSLLILLVLWHLMGQIQLGCFASKALMAASCCRVRPMASSPLSRQ